MTTEQLAQVCHAAYKKHADFIGSPEPDWENMNEPTKARWVLRVQVRRDHPNAFIPGTDEKSAQNIVDANPLDIIKELLIRGIINALDHTYMYLSSKL